MAFVDLAVADRFFALPLKERLARILDVAFPIWCTHVNEGVSLVYDNTCVMVHDVTAKIMGVETRLAKGGFEIFGSRQALRIEMALEQFNPDAGGFSTTATDDKLAYLFMLQSSIKAMTSEDFRFEPQCLLPPDETQNRELVETYKHVFSAQFRFWPKELSDYQSRREALHAALRHMPSASIVEQDFSAELRVKNRFKLKRKEPLETVATEVAAIAIGLDLRND
ncbi:hypothetical protein [Methyloferula stellata]|uniref:hypothetical protein n=1 Tax=Methyloferula stellata TaxID=876270 RepID=UPI00036D3868|nr:hypothetical protein [Methyloferula stellata]